MSIMTTKENCVTVRYRKGKADLKKNGSRKGKERMCAVIRKSYSYLESLRNASLDHEQWGFGIVCSDKIRLGRKTVIKDVGLLY